MNDFGICVFFEGEQPKWELAPMQLAGRLGLWELQRLLWCQRPMMVGAVPQRIGLKVVHSFTSLRICMILYK